MLSKGKTLAQLESLFDFSTHGFCFKLLKRGGIVILVTGGLGFIGSALIHELNRMGETDIVIVDRFREGEKWLNVRGLKYSEFVSADDLFTAKHQALTDKVNAIFHMGACSSTTELNMDFLYENNVVYSQKLFEWATSKKIPFLYASSAATYGEGELGYSDDEASIDRLRPLNPYGYSKQLFDEWVLAKNKRPPAWYGLKFFNVFGPGEYHKGSMASVVFHAFNQIQKNGSVKLFKSYREGIADGGQQRDFVYVIDICRAMIDLWQKDAGKKSGIYNMGTGTARSFEDLARGVFKSLGKTEKIEFIEMPEQLRGRYQYYTQAEMGKFLNTLPGFKFHSLEEGIDHYVKGYLANQQMYFNLKGHNS